MADEASIVHAFTDLYETLVKMTYLPRSAILTPPAQGWPLDPTTPTHKSPTVESLIRTLPYLDDSDHKWPIAPGDTAPINYAPGAVFSGLEMARDPMSLMAPPLSHAEYIPSSCLPLTDGEEEGTWLVLDTEPKSGHWTVTFWTPAELDDSVDRPDDQAEWRVWPCEGAVSGIQRWRDRYEKLEWIPIKTDGGIYILHTEKTGDDTRRRHADIARLYHEHGWPDNFDANTFKPALVQYIENDGDL